MKSVKTIALASAFLAATAFGAVAQTSGGSSMGNGTTTNGMNSMSKHSGSMSSTKHSGMMKKMKVHDAKSMGRNSGKNCTAKGGKKAQGHGEQC